MDCPTCNSPMSEGEISFEVSLAELVVGGSAFSQLVFREPHGKAVVVMNQSDGNAALRCKSCGHFLIITDPEYSDTECVVCKTPMPVGTSSCPACGWTYKQIENSPS